MTAQALLFALAAVVALTNCSSFTSVLCDRQHANYPARGQILFKIKIALFHKGYDFSGECNMTVAVTTVDLTPPKRGHMTAGPYYDMVCSKRIINTFVSLYTFMALYMNFKQEIPFN